MVLKKLDPSIPLLLRTSLQAHHRSIFLVIGSSASHTIPTLFQVRSKSTLDKSSILWTYKDDLGFSSHKKKRMKKLKGMEKKGLQVESATSFDLFLTTTQITYLYYKDASKALGKTYDMVVIQDFQSITPDLLAKTVETCRGGGVVVFLLSGVESLKSVYSMTMDVHSRYRGSSKEEVKPRFVERFFLSLTKSNRFLAVDEEFNILKMSERTVKSLKPDGVQGNVVVSKRQSAEDVELEKIKSQCEGNVKAIVSLCVTLCQAKSVLTFLDALSERAKTTVSLTSARGRGKSASVGMCVAAAVSYGYGRIALTGPEVGNLTTVMEFCQKGLDALNYLEHKDYTVIYDTSGGGQGDKTKAIVGFNIHREHMQTVTFHSPTEAFVFSNADLVCVDEAAAIPLPIIKSIIDSAGLSFISSTIKGYEGTGRGLSLKLIKAMREKKGGMVSGGGGGSDVKGKKGDKKVHEDRWKVEAEDYKRRVEAGEGNPNLKEITLTTPIRYGSGDPVETWLDNLLCLEDNAKQQLKTRPAPETCELYKVDRDALFSYHDLSEKFLHKVMGVLTSAHYKNSPNDLMLLGDSPTHRLFVLLGPENSETSLPDILAVVQVALEGNINKKTVEAQLGRGKREAGDMIPWTVSQQFGDAEFAKMSGARVVRLAVPEECQGMGYGSRAIEQVYRFYNGDFVDLGDVGSEKESDAEESDGEDEDEDESDEENNKGGLLNEKLKPRKKLPPLLLPLSEVKGTPQLDWIGTSFGLTPNLFKFWQRTGMKLLYLRQTANPLTGEHSSIMLRPLPNRSKFSDSWMPSFTADARRRFVNLLSTVFRSMEVRNALAVLEDVKAYHDKIDSRIDQASSGGSTKKERKVKNAANNLGDAISSRAGGKGGLTAAELRLVLTDHDMKRLELYGRNLCDHHLIADLVGGVARLQFLGRIKGVELSSVQSALMVGMGLQGKSVTEVGKELGLPDNQVLAMFNKAIRKMGAGIREAVEVEAANEFGQTGNKSVEGLEKMKDVTELTLEEEQEAAAEELKEKKKKKKKGGILDDDEIARYHVKGTQEEWKEALENKGEGEGGSVQVKRKRDAEEIEDAGLGENFKRSNRYYEEEEERVRESVGLKMTEKMKKDKKRKKKDGKKIREIGGLE
ncbi:hypothetical protein TrLO_g11739 [Triparma laevis f. longispina]|uniref:RNA cytidine acetyltransferase n=1 Tax=Triparma laevis f. longispina TaxID=1714387 RepID=A0A9W7C108_9STRA|nr:hypothetical protein TrLO_g11739 [Triparma laevis f. longispina]